MNANSILALIPAWNEGARIGPVLEGARAHLPVLVVDDGSIDDTAAVAQSVGATVVCHERNQGKGAALLTGFEWAWQKGYEAALTLDADGQHDPADIPAFVESYRSGDWDLVIGKRDFSQMPFPQVWVNPFGSWLLTQVMAAPILDNQSGYRLYTRRAMQALDLASSGFEMEVEVIVRALNAGMRIGWVDIKTIYGIDKMSYFHPIKDSARFLKMVWWAWQQRQRDGR